MWQTSAKPVAPRRAFDLSTSRKRNDVISSVCQVPTDEEEEVETVDGTELPEENGVLETDTVEVEEVTTDDENARN